MHCKDVSLWDSAPSHRKAKTPAANNSALSEMLEEVSFLPLPSLTHSSSGISSIGKSLSSLGWLWCMFLCFHLFHLPFSSLSPVSPSSRHPRRGLPLSYQQPNLLSSLFFTCTGTDLLAYNPRTQGKMGRSPDPFSDLAQTLQKLILYFDAFPAP